jgi:hypothetical protein
VIRVRGRLDRGALGQVCALLAQIPHDARVVVDLAHVREAVPCMLARLGEELTARIRAGRSILVRGLTRSQVKLLALVHPGWAP